jgi:hypothetical protein
MPITSSDSPSLNPVTAAPFLADLGFLVVPDLPERDAPAFLLVALREQPAYYHYDPELIEYWVNEHDRGVKAELTRRSRVPLETPFTWGLIRIVDRLHVSNEYLTFGGDLAAASVDGMTVAVFRSPAPLLQRGGHSQGWDRGAMDLGGFFGRLRAAAGYGRTFEMEAATADPLTRYSAFLAESLSDYRRSSQLRDRDPAFWNMLRTEQQRLERDHPTQWAAGARLLSHAKVTASGGAAG